MNKKRSSKPLIASMWRNFSRSSLNRVLMEALSGEDLRKQTSTRACTTLKTCRCSQAWVCTPITLSRSDLSSWDSSHQQQVSLLNQFRHPSSSLCNRKPLRLEVTSQHRKAVPTLRKSKVKPHQPFQLWSLPPKSSPNLQHCKRWTT